MIKTTFLLLFVALSFLPIKSGANGVAVQVPEDCVDRSSPCLIRTAGEAFQFNLGDLQVRVQKNTTLKVSSTDRENHFEILTGRISINIGSSQRSTTHKQLSLHGVVVADPRVMISREQDELKILNISNFYLSQYRLINRTTEPQLLHSEMADQKKLIDFSRYHFEDMKAFKKFLSSVAESWRAAYRIYSDNQTKVLRRTIASVREEQKKQDELNFRNSKKTKKVRDDFFSRTFER